MFRAKFVFPEIRIASDLLKPIKLHEMPDKPFKEKFGLSL